MGEGILDVGGPSSVTPALSPKGWAPREAPLYLDTAGSSRHRPMGSSELLPKGLGTKRGPAMNPATCPGRPKNGTGDAASAPLTYPTCLPTWGTNHQPKAGFRRATVHPGGRGRRQGRSKSEKGEKGKGEGRGGNPWADTRRMPPRGSRAPARVPAGCRRGPVRPETAAEPLQEPTNYSTIGGLP